MIRTEGSAEILDLPYGKVVAEMIDLISVERFLWCEFSRKPTTGELKNLLKLRRRLPPKPGIFVNVDTRIARNVKLARLFGFRTVQRVGHIAVMVLE